MIAGFGPVWFASIVLFAWANEAAPCEVSGAPPTLTSWERFRIVPTDDGAAALAPSGTRFPAVSARGTRSSHASPVGPALALGAAGHGAEVTFPDAAATGMDFSRPGSVSFWVAPDEWDDASSSYARFLLVSGPNNASFVVQRDMRRIRSDEDHFLIGFFGLPDKRLYYLHLRMERWKPSQWRFVALRWDRMGFEVSIDGRDFVRRSVPQSVFRDWAPKHRVRSSWTLGSGVKERTLLADFRVFSRQIDLSEVREIIAAAERSACWNAPRTE